VAKLLVPAGAKDIEVGAAVALLVEEEGQVRYCMVHTGAHVGEMHEFLCFLCYVVRSYIFSLYQAPSHCQAHWVPMLIFFFLPRIAACRWQLSRTTRVGQQRL
jgi:hypothetical protein